MVLYLLVLYDKMFCIKRSDKNTENAKKICATIIENSVTFDVYCNECVACVLRCLPVILIMSKDNSSQNHESARYHYVINSILCGK